MREALRGGEIDLRIREVDELLTSRFVAQERLVLGHELVEERRLVFLEHAVDRLREQRRLGTITLVPVRAHGADHHHDQNDDYPFHRRGAPEASRASARRMSAAWLESRIPCSVMPV